MVPVWYVFDGDDLVFNPGLATIWSKSNNMQRDGRVALCADLVKMPPYSYVTVEGTVTAGRRSRGRGDWATVIGGRYMGAERAEEFGRRNGVPGEYVVRLKPERVISERDLAG